MNKTGMRLILIFFVVLMQLPLIAFSQKKDTSGIKNIILMIGNGMGISQLSAVITANKGETSFSQFTAMGFSKPFSDSGRTAGSAAAATAIATGVLTHKGAVGVDNHDQPVPNIREIAQKHGLSTGLVITSPLASAVPGAFVAHVPNENQRQKIAEAYVESGIDVFIGGQGKWFYNPEKNINLVPGLRKQHYQICIYPEELKGIKKGKIAASIDQGKEPQRGNLMEIAAQKAIQILNQNPKGFFLMIGGSRIGEAGRDNSFDQMIKEMKDFDRVVGKVLEFAKNNGHTLVIATAENEIGGLALSDGNIETGEIEGQFMTTDPTPVMVPVFAYGPGSEAFTGIYNISEIFQKMKKAYNFF